ncbi:MAG: hypothetical protein EXX96DRAFT_567754 [Benjaminiella poitrasii]|nr:MAG: hypothetical protein EXX96DRAFT_567754 [Benjaminiella poitrasii]
MSLQEQLDALTTHSRNIASVQLRQGSNNVMADLFTQKRFYLRDAEPSEVKLAAICAGEPITARMKQDLANSLSSVERENIEKILKTANAMNQICNNPDIKERIEKNMRANEERQTNFDYLTETYKQTVSELEMLKSIDQSPTDEDNKDTDDMNDEYRISEEEAVIQSHNQELNQKRIQLSEIQAQKAEQVEIRNSLRSMKLKHNTTVGFHTTDSDDDEIRKLEKEIEEEKRKIADYESKIESLLENNASNDHLDSSTVNDLSVGFEARINKLLNSTDVDELPSSTENENIMRLLESIQNEIEPYLNQLKEIGIKERQEQAARNAYQKILSFIKYHDTTENSAPLNLERFNELFPANTETDTSFFKVNEEANVLTTILLQLLACQNMPLADLTLFIQDYAKQHNLSEGEAVQSIYKLVGLDLIAIDRTQNDSICSLKIK